MTRHLASTVALAIACLPGLAAPATAATLTQQTPNMDSPLTTPVGEVDFPFVHRFTVSGGKVENSPTFTLSTGLTPWSEVLARYATNSSVHNNFNEWEALVRAHLGPTGLPVGVTGSLGFNGAANSVDAAILGAYDVGPVGLRGTIKGFSNFWGVGGPSVAAGVGLIWHVNRLVALDADFSSLAWSSGIADLNFATNGAAPTWSAGVTLDLPYTPHSLSLYVTNANTRTLEGATISTSGVDPLTNLHYGFEFMIPFTNFGRYGAWAHPDEAAPTKATAATPTAAAPAGPAQPVEIATFKYGPADVTIPRGATETWTNRDAIGHTATADDGSWDSGLLATGASWSHTFDRPGDYPYHCAPHPFMKGTIHVK